MSNSQSTSANVQRVVIAITAIAVTGWLAKELGVRKNTAVYQLLGMVVAVGLREVLVALA